MSSYCSKCLLFPACQARGERQIAKRGDTAILSGQSPRHVLLLLDGLVAAFRTTQAGYDNLAVLILPGDFWGLAAFYKHDSAIPLLFDTEHGDYGYQFRAVVPSVFCKVARERFTAFMEQDHGLALRVMNGQLRLLRNQIQLHSFSAKGQGQLRLIALLLIIAERVGKPAPNGLTIPFELHHADLAELGSLSRPVVTRNLLELRRLKLIEIDQGTICLRDIPPLVRAIRS